jgi:hypothetical protein
MKLQKSGPVGRSTRRTRRRAGPSSSKACPLTASPNGAPLTVHGARVTALLFASRLAFPLVAAVTK